jgi:acetylornithine/succinyldiaminopimelate/putrescine aminotransferase
MHGSTFGGGPLPCRLALAFLDAVDGEGLLDAVAARGRQLIEGLQSLASRHGVLRKVRGRGLMIGVEMEHPVEPILDRLRERGILAGSAGRNVLRLLPPFVVSVEEIDRFLDTFDGVLTLDATTGDRNAAAGVPEAGGRS